MLVLARKPLFRTTRILPAADVAAHMAKDGHGVWIGPDIRVRVLSYDNGLVRLGIDAPRSLYVWRDELEAP